jgi:hypothetical protein
VTTALDSESAIRRGLAQVGHADGSGACLANVYQWFGGPAWSSIGRGAGDFGRAIDGWNYADYKHAGDWSPPPGVPVYFGVDTPRTDANAAAGDVALSIGGGRVVCTDSPTGNTGIMTIAARAIQARRNYLGWTADFLGYPVSGALSFIQQSTGGAKPAKPIIVVKSIPEGLPPMYVLVPVIRSGSTGPADIYIRGARKSVKITDPAHVRILERIRRNDGTDRINAAEWKQANVYIEQACGLK